MYKKLKKIISMFMITTMILTNNCFVNIAKDINSEEIVNTENIDIEGSFKEEIFEENAFEKEILEKEIFDEEVFEEEVFEEEVFEENAFEKEIFEEGIFEEKLNISNEIKKEENNEEITLIGEQICDIENEKIESKNVKKEKIDEEIENNEHEIEYKQENIDLIKDENVEENAPKNITDSVVNDFENFGSNDDSENIQTNTIDDEKEAKGNSEKNQGINIATLSDLIDKLSENVIETDEKDVAYNEINNILFDFTSNEENNNINYETNISTISEISSLSEITNDDDFNMVKNEIAYDTNTLPMFGALPSNQCELPKNWFTKQSTISKSEVKEINVGFSQGIYTIDRYKIWYIAGGSGSSFHNSIVGYYDIDTHNVSIVSYDNICLIKLKDCSDLFDGFSNVESIRIGRFTDYIDISEVTDMTRMFNGCTNLKEISYSNVDEYIIGDTSNCQNMSYMFCGCENLDFSTPAWGKPFINILNTSNVTSMRRMFANCKSLKITDMTKFDTSKCINMESMFENCNLIETIDLSTFKTGKVINFNNMFSGCTSLKTIYASSKFVKTYNTEVTMFNNCNLLEGGNGTTFIDGSSKYACIDIDSNNGYFTYKNSSPAGKVYVYFFLQGYGNVEPYDMEIAVNQKIIEPIISDDTNYEFCGWYEEKECLNK